MIEKAKRRIEKELEEKSGSLNLWNCKIDKIPEVIGNMTWLTSLNLSGNQITKIEGFEALASLNSLDLSSNQINKIEGLEALASLNSLSLGGNQINKIEGLEALASLNSLSLYRNQITKIEGLEALASLNSLSLYSNQITKIEGLEALASLNSLSLYSNQITKIEGLEALASLNSLSLYSNQITKIEGLDGLTNLGVLDFENNPISELNTKYLSFLSSIPFLNLKGTKIKDISFLYENINQGTKILWEDIVQSNGKAPNEKDYFEYTIGKSTYHVKRGINVKDCNELDTGLIAAIQSGQDTLLTYINEPRKRLFEARVLVLGEPRAGKTTLRKKLLDVSSAMPTELESTKAFEIEIEPYECEIELGDQKEQLRYHLWDFGGQDYYRLLHQLFVTEQSVYIIVVDTDRNKNEEEIAFWLDTIERLGKDDSQHYGPVILVQNPKNKRTGGTFTDLKRRYPFWQQTEDFVINLNALNKEKSDSFDEQELGRFRNFEKYLSRSFCHLDHVGKDIPIKWISVRKALLEEKENYISVERFNAICTLHKIKDKAERSDLLNIFRQLGYLLHYKNTALKGMVILNREWITDALYRVLDDQTVEDNKGWFAKSDAEKIWHEEKYENRTLELLALMQVFKLCYQNSTTKKYIVPFKLPSSVYNLPEWDTTDNVRLRLKYDWMPKALPLQLIVSLHEYIVTLPDSEQWIWRKGAVLDGKQLGLEDVQVRIRDEYDDKCIAIDARGPHSEILFRIIMKKWKEVNEPFENKVRVTHKILCPCDTCADLDTPTDFRYLAVLNAKQHGETIKCNESFKSFKADDILKGVYDDTTVLLDSLKGNKKEHSIILNLIRANKLDEAIAAITSPEYNVLFGRRLNELKTNDQQGMLTLEQKMSTRSTLAKDLIDYLYSNRREEDRKMKFDREEL